MTLRVLVVDDHPIFVMGLERLLTSAGLELCGHARTVAEALRSVHVDRPDAVVVDLSLPDGSGLQLLRRLREDHPDLPTVVVSMHDEELFARRAIAAGARGYVTKETAPDRIVDALRRVARGELVLGDRVRARIFEAGGSAAPELDGWIGRLSDRELEVFELLGRGLATKEIAARLGISVKTVETHQAKTKDKLGLSSMAELIRAAAIWTDGGAARSES